MACRSGPVLQSVMMQSQSPAPSGAPLSACLATGPGTSADFYNNKYKHKRGGVIVFTFIFMLKTSIYRGDARIYLCGVESK